ncbi:2Fe-2S iron-sulfur cluster-binding protein [Vibrio rhizosphaerae]|uniref:2Fe-2S iron-sulfur cluster binding domain-containing protein n=1 Tax=Vibrio rhizosphaerae TaxID=398736 RepID=A0ABU4IPR2_9VIBR|nr:2Fe-2S iron-sulfur cluster binding domain-containing protein [Vibrio rhizosphaerae]MDW6091092.1 2Fe-2S iron-sulfur cluster binding domain-containing protein [Vibrio rhizosphaerae]
MFGLFKKIQVDIDGTTYPAAKNSTLLRVCLSHGINIQYKCQSGVCGKCAVIEHTSQGDIPTLACQKVISPSETGRFSTIR